VTVAIEPQAMAERCFCAELFFRYAFDQSNETLMSFREVFSDFREGETALLFRHRSIESVNATVGYRVARRFASFENGRQVL